MKKIGKALLMVGAVSLVYAASASAMVTVTKHNFSSQGAEGQKVFLATPGDVNGEVCVFCHSPHVGQQVANAPLWNRAVASGNYTPYTSSTIDAPGVTSDRQPKGVSLACLSCHDGTIALDALRNAPGSGNFQDTPTTRGWSWSGLSGTNNASNSLPEDGRITNLTQNLSGQHPISIEYPYYGSMDTSTAYDPKFFRPEATNASGLRWFDYGPRRGKPDDNEVRMYKTDSASDKAYVECASCHNPHGTEAKDYNTGDPGPDGINYATFLRRSNNQSALCTTCHIK